MQISQVIKTKKCILAKKSACWCKLSGEILTYLYGVIRAYSWQYFITAKSFKLLNPLRDMWPMEPALISSFCSVKRLLTPPGWDTNPSQISSQQTLVLIYLSRKAELAQAGKKVTQISSNLGRAADRTGDLVAGRQRSYQLHQPCPPNISSLTGGKNNSKFQHGNIFHLVLSEYFNQTTDFTNLIFVTSSLGYSIRYL